METQGETKAPTKGRWHMSARDAARWAVIISLACNVLLIEMILGSLSVKKLPDWLFPGSFLWNAVFGGPWHSMIWLFSTLALNFIIYAVVIFIVEVVFMFWRRRLHPANTNSRIFP